MGVRAVFGSLNRGLESVRRVTLNLIFLLFLLLIIAALMSGSRRPPIPDSGALLLQPAGMVVDQLSLIDPLSQLQGATATETLLSNLIEAVERATDDPRITVLVLALNDLEHIGLSKTLELAPAIDAFRASGKPVVAVASNYDQQQYLLAALADEIYVQPLGGVALEGFAVYRNYFLEALERLKVSMHVFRVGSYKSAMEPFLRNDMSEEDKRANRAWLDQLWQRYSDEVTARRNISAERFSEFVNKIDEVLARYDGDAAHAALARGLVDGIMTGPQMRAFLAERAGYDPDRDFRYSHFSDYLAQTDEAGTSTGSIAVIPVVGDIVDGENQPGAAGGDTISQFIREAADDSSVKAVVLRVDSGGGSVLASEQIRDELLQLQASGRPLLVSMGSVAASGGYWIAASADEIWALPTTLTGSIGIFGAFPTFEKALEHWGVHTDGVGTTALAGSLRFDRAPPERLERAIQSALDFGYDRFIRVVSDGRGLDETRVREAAGGRVWTGADAKTLGLVDQLGGLDSTLASAATQAGLENYEVIWMEESLPESLLRQLAGAAVGWLGVQWTGLSEMMARLPVSPRVFNDPRGMYALCGECARP